MQLVTFAITRAVTGIPFLDHTVGTNYGFGLLYIPIIALVISAVSWLGLELLGAAQSRNPESRGARRVFGAGLVLALALEALACGGTLLLVIPNYPTTVAVIAIATGPMCCCCVGFTDRSCAGESAPLRCVLHKACQHTRVDLSQDPGTRPPLPIKHDRRRRRVRPFLPANAS
ncbi:hypothetical protein P9139_02865 [Curtobacterium flaccumfaciens]|nr:hypothetical protein P9139_02865 [Curtobacterium flaccumfaciens]